MDDLTPDTTLEASVLPSPPPTRDPDLIKIESDWGIWLSALFPDHFSEPFAPHHIPFWDHVWSIQPGVQPPPYIAIWPSGHGKSLSVEAACVALGARGIRSYCIYISSTAEQAEKHVNSINSMLESLDFEAFYPDHADRALGKYGASIGWRRNRLRTAGGFTIDALGLGTAIRGLRIDEMRPDLIVFDDLDVLDDTLDSIEKKIRQLTRTVLPARGDDCAIFGAQNLIHRDGIFSRLAGTSDYKADYLAKRIVSGPIPAVENMETALIGDTYQIIGGHPTWRDLETCQFWLEDSGFSAFMAEYQHDVDIPPGGLYDHVVFSHITREELKSIIIDRTVLWIDPAVTSSDSSDCSAIQIDALGRDGKIYRLWSWEQRATPQETLELALRKALDEHVSHIGIEDIQGKLTWESVLKDARQSFIKTLHPRRNADDIERLQRISLKSQPSSQSAISKTHRSSQMLSAYERGQIVHVEGTHHILEAALRRFPRTKPLDLADAAAYAWHDLRGKHPAKSLSARGRTVSRMTSNNRRLIAVR